MITKYLDKALARAKYEALDDGSHCATVPGLCGVIALRRNVENCRRKLAEVIEAWIPVRVSRARPRRSHDQDPARELMPHFNAIKRRDLIAALRKLGFTGPSSP